MDSIDTFASLLLEESKRFLELASDASHDEGVTANLHASMVLAFCALEAHVNAVSDEMAFRKGLTAHEGRYCWSEKFGSTMASSS